MLGAGRSAEKENNRGIGNGGIANWELRREREREREVESGTWNNQGFRKWEMGNGKIISSYLIRKPSGFFQCGISFVQTSSFQGSRSEHCR